MLNQTIWNGKVSQNWTEIANWTNGVPTFGIHAHIPNLGTDSRYPVISNNLKINFTLKNDGILHIEAELLIQQNGILQNYGRIKNSDIALVTNEGNVINFGEWINQGACENKRIFTNNHRLFNEGLIENNNTFVNLGSLVNTGVIDNYKAINNAGRLENFNIIENHGKAEIIDEAFFPKGFTNEIVEIPK